MIKKLSISLIEVIVMICIVGVFSMIATGYVNNTSNVSWGFNGMTEVRCIDGYKFVVGEQGNARQVMDDSGRGVRCGNPDPGKVGSFGSN